MMRRQTGAVLVMVAILIVVLIGVAALALDVGRLLVLRSEMHNAVDAASLAAAAELNGAENAQERAEYAAMTLLKHNSKFAIAQDILGDQLVKDVDIKFDYFCAIENNLESPNLTDECDGGQAGGEGQDAKKIRASGDADSHYVRVTLNPVVNQNADQPRYSIELYFLPVLRTLGLPVPEEASTTATALAGRSFVICKYPPLMICDPYEGQTETNNGLTKQKTLKVGQQIKVYMGASSPGYWAPGDFGLLEPPSGKGGAVDVSEYLASDGLECTDPLITTKTGVQVNMVKWGLNTRFGIYEFKYNAEGYPPAPNVLDYPRDTNLAADPSARIGSGVWQSTANEYWTNYTHNAASPGGLSTRYEHYQWEVNNGDYPVKSTPPLIQCNAIDNNGCPTDSTIWRGRPNPDNKVAGLERRVITVPVLNCTALGISGKERGIWVAKEEYWKKFFITEHVNDPSAGAEIFAEYLGDAGDRDGTFHVEVKLYE